MEEIMILPNNVAILRNIKDSFYYNGIEISKENFNIQEFAKVCSKVNDIKGQLRQEKALNNIKQDHTVIGYIELSHHSYIYLLCKVNKENIYFGLYDNYKKQIIPLQKEIISEINDRDMYSLAFELNKTANLISKNLINCTLIKDTVMLHTFENYIETLKKSGNNFQNTYELEFINGYKEYILTDEQLKQSLVER